MDRETGKISLGYKQLQKKPYEVAAEKFPVGTVIKGKVERIFPYGAFVSIDEGVDGLVHVSQISHNWIKDANEALTVGQEVEAKIIGFDDNRITLSIKELLPAPEETASNEAQSEATDEEKAAKRSSRVKKFEQKVADGEGKRERRNAKKETSNEPKEWFPDLPARRSAICSRISILTFPTKLKKKLRQRRPLAKRKWKNLLNNPCTNTKRKPPRNRWLFHL